MTIGGSELTVLRVRGRRAVMAATVLAVAVAIGAPVAAAPSIPAAHLVRIVTLSNRADLISSGDALVQVLLPPGADASTARMDVDSRDVTGDFATRADGRLEGLVSGLRDGPNVLTARLPDGYGARLTITNHPSGGPVFTGPQEQPWKCEKGAVDAQCNQPPVYTYLYRSSDPSKAGLQPYDPKSPPSDVASTTTDTGVTVPFVVRLETGYEDRDQYKFFTLFDPGKPWSRWEPQRQFNHKLLITHGGGCGASHASGTAPTDDFSGTIPTAPGYTQSYITALGRGFATMSTALDNTGHNCNVATEAESLMMAKERLIEQYGDVRYTIGTGCSGGSIAQQTIANAYPGAVYDGLVITCAYPDSLTAGAQFADYHLLRLYFENPAHADWNPAQWAAVEGRPDPVNAVAADEELFKGATDPSGDCVPADQAYNAQSNPGGARCSILDHAINVLGPRPESVWSANERKIAHGFAGIPFANSGIQYGLSVLRQGLITPAQFVDLNAKIGGLDIDVQPSAQRLAGDDASIANAYRSGLINEENNISGVAIIDHAGPDPGAAHDYAHTWWIRDRLDRAQGNHDNHVLWFGPTPLIGDLNWANEALTSMDRWLAAVEQDHSTEPVAHKIAADKPADIADRCTADVCKQYAATRYGTPRSVAGGDETNDNMKCQLKPLARSDYPLPFTDAQWAQLQQAFPAGVCDWTKPGVAQQPTIPWMTYQDAAGKVIYGGRAMGPAPVSVPFGPAACTRRELTFRVSGPHGVRIERARVYLDGRLLRTVRAAGGQVLRRFTIGGLPSAGGHVLRIDTVSSHGRLVRRSSRTISGCSTKGRPHTRGRFLPLDHRLPA